jgi:hypothetical protein
MQYPNHLTAGATIRVKMVCAATAAQTCEDIKAIVQAPFAQLVS